MVEDSRILLRKTARLFRKHEAARLEPFNLFSVLIGTVRECATVLPDVHGRTREKSFDSVSILPGDTADLPGDAAERNLHSRFLKALLDRRNGPRGERENLADFLGILSDEIPSFDSDKAAIYRGFEDSDIVIHDASSRQVVLIENRIRGGTGTGRLQEYAKHLRIQGYATRLLYLTLDARLPPEKCGQILDHECISCRLGLVPWLKRCQQRACNEPPLRESIGQYLHLLVQMTGTDYSEDYMKDLVRLCQKDGNLLLVKDLKDAMVETEVGLLLKVWQGIARKLEDRIPDLPELSEDISDITKGTIRRFLTDRKYRWHGLFYGFGKHVYLGVVAENTIRFGVVCTRQISLNDYGELKKSLDRRRGEGAGYLWQCPRGFEHLNLRNPGREDLKILGSKRGRKQYIEEIVSGMQGVWKRVKDGGLA